MPLISKPTHDPKLTRWWWRTLREWTYNLVNPLWAAFRGENSDDIKLVNVTGINDVTATELSVLDGLAATKTELNKLSGLTANAAELNKSDRTKPDGVAEASKAIVLDASKNISGKRYDINRSLVESLSRGPSYHIGESAVITIAGAEELRFCSNDFSIAARVKSKPNTPGSAIISMLDGIDDGWRLIFYNNGDVWGSINSIDVKTNSHDVLNNEWKLVGISYKRNDNGQMYVDGVPNGPPVDISGETLDIATETVTIGYSAEFNINCIYLFNRALSSEDWQRLASGAALDFADLGANETDLVINGEDWTGASGTTPPNSWSDGGVGTATYIIRDNSGITNFGDNKSLELSASSGSKSLYQSISQANKRYRISFVYRNLNGSSSSYVALGSDDNKVSLQNTGISGNGVLFRQELIADGTDLKFFVDSGGTLQIDHVKVVQIGCVAAYLPSGITHAQWQDASGNELHGMVNGALPLNLPSNHIACYARPGIEDDTALSNIIPGGYRIKSILADVTGASSGMILNVGTTSGGNDVVNGEDISSNGLFDLTVAKKIYSLSDAQSLYVNDDGGTPWSGISIDLYITSERVK